MANRNGKGPDEKGPKTGRQMGNCEGAEPAVGRGRGRGCGPCGQGRGRRFRREANE